MKALLHITRPLRHIIYFLVPFLLSFVILEQVRDLSIKQILLTFIWFIIYFKIKNIILSMKSSKGSKTSNIYDAIASELILIQSKLDRLMNNVAPCFTTPKEMKADPMKCFDFGQFVGYWRAYSAYPEIAQCILTDNDMDKRYEICLKENDIKMQKNRIYLSCIDGKIAYSMIAAFDTPVYDILTHIEAPKEWSLSSLNKQKKWIILWAIQHGNIQPPAFILLKKTDGLTHYDPLAYDLSRCGPVSISEKDLVNMHSGGPLSYKNISIKKGSIIKAYIYDRDTVGFLNPDESEITVISVDDTSSDEYSRYKTFKVEVRRVWCTGHKEEPIIMTIGGFEY